MMLDANETWNKRPELRKGNEMLAEYAVFSETATTINYNS